MLKNSQTLPNLFDTWAEEGGYPPFRREEYLEMLSAARTLQIPGKRVLELGCGVGHVSSILKSLGHKVVGVDLSPIAIAVARKEGWIDEGVVADITATQLPGEQFDIVICFMVLLCVFDLSAALTEIARLLKPGGEVILVDHHSRNPYTKLHFARPDWIDRLLEGRGNVPRHPLNEQMVMNHSPKNIQWDKPKFYSFFTEHPNRRINFVHRIARSTFSLIRSFIKVPWTGNIVVVRGEKMILAKAVE